NDLHLETWDEFVIECKYNWLLLEFRRRMPVFAENDDNDLERFFELYKCYIHSIGIDLLVVTGNPAGWEKAMGILRACLIGPAARWYDSNILGKRVKLRNILLHLAHGDEAAFKTLLGTNFNCPVNT
ncbi:hypothetical protein RclHR1_32390001, partial [Rhizophagus clarus]